MADIADDEFIEEFITFGVSVNNSAVLDKLRQFCQLYGLGAEEIACEWLAFNKSKKCPLSPNIETLEQFDRERLNKSGSKPRPKLGRASPVMYTVDTIDEVLDEEDLDKNELVNQYATPKSMSKKRQRLDEAGSNKRLTNVNRSPQLIFSPRSLSSPSTAPSEKYRSRSNAGEVLIKFGTTDGTSWSRAKKKDLVISNYDPDMTLKECKYMFEKLCEKSHNEDNSPMDIMMATSDAYHPSSNSVAVVDHPRPTTDSPHPAPSAITVNLCSQITKNSSTCKAQELFVEKLKAMKANSKNKELVKMKEELLKEQLEVAKLKKQKLANEEVSKLKKELLTEQLEVAKLTKQKLLLEIYKLNSSIS